MNAPRDEASLSPGQVIFVIATLAAAVGIMAFVAYRYIVPPPPPGNLARDARDLWRSNSPAAYSQPLTELLEQTRPYVVPSQPHELLGKAPPDFRLLDAKDEYVAFADLADGRPVVVVFYLGYACDHCVAQLFGLQQDLRYFRELDARVVAISDDPTAHTREQYAQYGSFTFPVLSDRNNEVSQRYGVYRAKTDSSPEDRRHGTFLISAEGKVVWANVGEQPFYHNGTLLNELAKLKYGVPIADTSPIGRATSGPTGSGTVD